MWCLLVHQVRFDGETWVEGPYSDEKDADEREKELQARRLMHTVIKYEFRVIDPQEDMQDGTD